MSKTKPEELPEPIVLTVSLIESGKFIRAGESTPYLRAEDVPAHLREYIADGSEEFYTHAERLIYDGRPDYGEPPTVYRFLDGQGRGIRRQAAQVASGLQQQSLAEQEVEASHRLAPEIEEALQAKHDLYVGRAKAQLQYDRDASDSLHESLDVAREPLQLFAKRGSVFARIEKIKLLAGENIFAKHPGGNYEIIGTTDVDGVPPEPPIVL